MATLYTTYILVILSVIIHVIVSLVIILVIVSVILVAGRNLILNLTGGGGVGLAG